MGAALASRNRIVLEIAYDGPASSSRSVDVDANDPRIAELLDSLLADPNTGKVVSLSGYRARHGEIAGAAAPDFSGAMRLVEQECYSHN